MSVRRRHALITVVAGVFAIAAAYILWPSSPPSPDAEPARPPVSVSGPDVRPDTVDELGDLRDDVAAALRRSPSATRDEELKSLDARLGELEPTIDKTSLAAVEVLEAPLRQSRPCLCKIAGISEPATISSFFSSW